MNDLPLIFLSHSSNDGELAQLLAREIEREMGDEIRVFASTRPDAIPSGTDWLMNVLESLDRAEALIMLITESAKNSVWIGFELGYFWKKLGKTAIYTLHHETVKVPSPLDTLQAKLITRDSHVRNFLEVLCKQFGRSFTNKADIQIITHTAETISNPMAERSMVKFRSHIEDSEWEEAASENRQLWICQNDVLFQIEVDLSSENEEFEESWTKKFPASPSTPARKYKVNLLVAGSPVMFLTFISVAGGRYLVPLPEVIFNTDDTERYVWKRDSLIYGVAKIISHFYPIFPTLEDFAAQAGISIE